jgi:uncharacterized membrane protein
MSGFEFVLVLYAIISGLGISDVLSGWGEQVRARHRISPYPLQIALSFLLMYFGISILWSFWTFRDINWTFSHYIAFAIIPLLISLASRIIRVDTSVGSLPPRDQYFLVAPAVFMLMSCVPLMIVLFSQMPSLREQVADRPEGRELVLLTIYRVTISVGLLYVAWSKKVSVHWIGIGVMFITVVLLSIRLTVREIGGVP